VFTHYLAPQSVISCTLFHKDSAIYYRVERSVNHIVKVSKQLEKISHPLRLAKKDAKFLVTY